MIQQLKELRSHIRGPELALFKSVWGIYKLILTFERVRYKNEYVTPVTKDEMHDIITDLLYSSVKRNRKTKKPTVPRATIRRILEREIINPKDLDKFQTMFK